MKHGKREIKNKNNNQSIQQEYSPINTKKINALSQMYANLPKSGFSKLTVSFCLFFALLTIITSFVFLYFGIDASNILQFSLLFFGGELLTLGLKGIFSREQTKDDIIFDQIRKEINDGNYYDESGRIVYTEDNSRNNNFNNSNNTNNSSNTTSCDTYIDNSVINNYNTDNELIDENEQEVDVEQQEEVQEVKPIFDASTIEVPVVQNIQVEPKKRGRPKKTEPKEEQVQGYIGEFGSVDDDGRD